MTGILSSMSGEHFCSAMECAIFFCTPGCSSWMDLLLPTRQFPCFSVFPGHVGCVVEVQQQPFATVRESEAEEIVVDERRSGAYDDIDYAEAAASGGQRHFRA